MGRNISDAEIEMMSAQQDKQDPSIVFEKAEEYVDLVVEDTNRQITEIDELGKRAQTAVRENYVVKEEIKDAVDNVHEYGDIVKDKAYEMKNSVDAARDAYKQAKKEYRREQHEANIMMAKEKLDKAKRVFDHVAEKTREGLNKTLDLTKEAGINIAAAKNAAEQNYHRSNLKKGLDNIMYEFACTKRGAVAQELREATAEKTQLEIAKSNKVAEVNKKAKNEAEKVSQSFWHKARLGFSKEGRDRLRNPEKDVEILQAKLLKKGEYKKDLKAIDKEYDKPIRKATKEVADLTEKKSKIESKIAAYKDIMDESPERVTFKEAKEQVRAELEKAKAVTKEAPVKEDRSQGEER